jgi:hypothetical protein
MKKLTQALEVEISILLPSKFVLVLDGWTQDSSSSHYIAIFAQFIDLKGIIILLS